MGKWQDPVVISRVLSSHVMKAMCLFMAALLYVGAHCLLLNLPPSPLKPIKMYCRQACLLLCHRLFISI